MGIREELAEGNFGVTACLMPLNDFQVTFLAKAVPERGEALWLRFRAWQRDGHDDQGFPAWVQSMAQAVLAAALQPQPATTLPPRRGGPAPTEAKPPNGVIEDLKSTVRRILRTATSEEDAGEQIRLLVNSTLSPSSQSCAVHVTWDTNPNFRSASIIPQGHNDIHVRT